MNPHVTDPDYLAVRRIPRFLRLLYTYIDPANDPEHEGIFSPDMRDSAQHFRGTIVQRLVEASPAIDAYSALMEFSTFLPEGEEKRSMVDRANQRARAEADKAWEESQFVEFSKRYATIPQTSNELYLTALDRLVDIKDKMEHGDFSPRGDFNPGDHEHKIQRLLATHFESTSRGLYETVRESVVADDKIIDIRLIRASLDPITIEVKWAHNNSYNAHKSAVENQLVGQYMRNYHSQHGIYLMVNLEPDRHWQPDDGVKLDFLSLCERLQQEADSLLLSRGAGERVTIIGIDLTPKN